jgi:hypothetical protein
MKISPYKFSIVFKKKFNISAKIYILSDKYLLTVPLIAKTFKCKKADIFLRELQFTLYGKCPIFNY